MEGEISMRTCNKEPIGGTPMSHSNYTMLRNIRVIDLYSTPPVQIAKFTRTCSRRVKAMIELSRWKR
jgi:hypothetical protein